MKSLLTIIIIFVTCAFSEAQVIQPRDLYAINTSWQNDAADADREAYKTIKLVDANWSLLDKPTNDASGFLAIYGYTKDHKAWYKAGTCILTLVINRDKSNGKSLMYQFTEKSTWDIYRNQIDGMHPTVLGGGANDGGNNVVYKVNGLLISLTDFPPGMKDDERTYQIQIYKDK